VAASATKTATIRFRSEGERGRIWWEVDLSDRPEGWPLAKYGGDRATLQAFLDRKGYACTFAEGA
jgi:hypothetical protein